MYAIRSYYGPLPGNMLPHGHEALADIGVLAGIDEGDAPVADIAVQEFPLSYNFV